MHAPPLGRIEVRAPAATRLATPEFATTMSSRPKRPTASATMRVDGLAVADVGLHARRRADRAPRTSRGRRLGGVAIAAVVDRDVGALARELERRCRGRCRGRRR